MYNVVTANFSCTYQWLLSNISDFTMWTQQVMENCHFGQLSLWTNFTLVLEYWNDGTGTTCVNSSD